MSIPKLIHYCWFGNGEKSELMLKCINSWKKYMPDYEIVEWNESNFVIDNDYAREALAEKKYAFVSDYARLKIVYENGGIYLDTDVELIRSLSPILELGGYIGYERSDVINTGLGFAAEPYDEVIKKMLSTYDNLRFIVNNEMDLTPCPTRNTQALSELDLLKNNSKQRIGNINVYPKDYFCPIDYDSGEMIITDNTYSIHHYGYSWADDNSKKILNIKRKIFSKFSKPIAEIVFYLVNHFYLLVERILKK